jgi:predicted helicase
LVHEFKTSLSAENVHLIDPFTGTGTFIVRLLQLGIIKPKDLLRKYQHELHANEIVLLAYYIAAINIEETFHTLQREAAEAVDYKGPKHDASAYVPFDGIVLTDTFQLTESASDYHTTGDEKMFPENNKRVSRQRKSPIRVVAGNPPYSVGQNSANDNNQNLKYKLLDSRIADTYVAKSTATNKNSLYDSYIRAIRWASDRIEDQGIVAFVTNGSFIDNNSMAGLRACLADEFTSLYIFNLRGNARTSGEQRRMEKDNVFGMGSRTPVAISILVRNPAKKGTCELYYRDIGDYLSREDKLGIISDYSSIMGLHRKNVWHRLKPNEQHDWINLRDPAFDGFIPLGDKKERTAFTFFENYSNGVKTNRDFWAYNFSEKSLSNNIRRLIQTYNAEVDNYAAVCKGSPDSKPDLDEVVNSDPKIMSWSAGVLADAARGRKYEFRTSHIFTSMYRPFSKYLLYFDRNLNDRTYQIPKLFPTNQHSNISISVTGAGENSPFSCLITNDIPNLHLLASGQAFPLYLYEKDEPRPGELLREESEGELSDGYRRRHAITAGILKEFRKTYGKDVSKEDIFYYVYGILHSPEYRTRFASDLKKMLPRIPLTQETADYKKFTKAGRDLAQWHLNYETIEAYPLAEISPELGLDPWKQYHVTKMTFDKPSPTQKAAGQKQNKTTIHYNSHLTLDGIPLEAYDYIVNGKPALEWIMERYQITIDKASAIKNDPNDWCREHNNPRYIVDLIKRVTRVSLETMKIVNALPALNERK